MASSRRAELAEEEAYPSAASEVTPLLAAGAVSEGVTNPSNEESLIRGDHGDIVDGNHDGDANKNIAQIIDEDDKPLPVAQIWLLCFARLVEPIAFFSIVPFINQMIEVVGQVREEDIGFWAGLIESLFSVTQMLLMISWGRAADRFGRKPTLVISLLGMSVGSVLFGFSKSLWQMILFRCAAGAFSGVVVSVRAMISENSTKRTQARAFSYFAFVSNMGIMIGPLIGGALADPAGQYENSFFTRVQFFKDFPFALPTIVTGVVAVTAAVICTLFVKETLPGKADVRDPPKPMSTSELVKSKGVTTVLFIYGWIMFLAFTYTALTPVFEYTSIKLGGFSFTKLQISIAIAIAGASQAAWLLIVFPPLNNRIGTGNVLRSCAVAWPIFFSVAPILAQFRKHDNKGWAIAFWIIFVALQVISSGLAMAFTSVQLALNDVSPSPATLGTLNALALTLTSGIRAVAPAAINSLYAIGVGNHIFGGELAWIVLIAFAAATPFIMRWFPSNAEGKLSKRSSNEEE